MPVCRILATESHTYGRFHVIGEYEEGTASSAFGGSFRFRCCGTPEYGLHTCDHFTQGERLGNIIIPGSPWEVASVKNLLKAAYIEVSMKENGRNGFLVP